MAKKPQQQEKPKPDEKPVEEAPAPVEVQSKPVEETPAEAAAEMLRRMND